MATDLATGARWPCLVPSLSAVRQTLLSEGRGENRTVKIDQNAI
jgi:hypothetical protein